MSVGFLQRSILRVTSRLSLSDTIYFFEAFLLEAQVPTIHIQSICCIINYFTYSLHYKIYGFMLINTTDSFYFIYLIIVIESKVI